MDLKAPGGQGDKQTNKPKKKKNRRREITREKAEINKMGMKNNKKN